MIITRTLFVSPSVAEHGPSFYYEKRGGFLVTSAIDKYMYVAVNTPLSIVCLRVKYSKSETVKSVYELQHELAGRL